MSALARALADVVAGEDHAPMHRPLRVALLGLAAACAGACKSPTLRIPFPEEGSGLHVMAIGGERATNDRYHDQYSWRGVEVTTLYPGADGFGWDLAVRWADTSGDDFERIRVFLTDTSQNPDFNFATTEAVPTKRNSDIYEISLGVRQTYFADSSLQPYLGVGGSFFKTKNVDHLDVPAPTPPNIFTPGHEPPRTEEHWQSCAWGLYLSTGLVWNVLRDQIYDNTEFVIDLNVRGLLGDEFSFVEVALGFGFGK